jgi:hypothetical protein
MRKNFPNSEYYTPGGPQRNAPWWRIWDPNW